MARVRRPPQIGPFSAGRPALFSASGLWRYESAVRRVGYTAVAGADEAGRGACAGPLVVAACILPERGRISGLDDSKALTPAAREKLYPRILRHCVASAVVVIDVEEIDRYGLHVANLAGMRRAIGQLDPAPDYALTDGFSVSGLPVPATAVWKGDAVVACVSAASILAKVTRDRIMIALHEDWPVYDFAQHKGYITADHARALSEHGPSPVHRHRYVNVRRALALAGGRVASVGGGARAGSAEVSAADDLIDMSYGSDGLDGREPFVGEVAE